MLHKKPEITYPTKWHYKIICEDEESFCKELFEIMNKEYVLEPSKISKQGKYKSFSLITEVSTQEERDAVFVAIKELKTVSYVL